MEKSFEGITKEDFRSAYVDGSDIVIQYVEVYDLDEDHSTKFLNDMEIEDTPENRKQILDVFNVDLNEGQNVHMKTVQKPEESVIIQRIDVVTTAWFTCPYCGYTMPYEIEGVKKRKDMHYIITTECCGNKLELKGKKDM